jgi:hypothetical protein
MLIVPSELIEELGGKEAVEAEVHAFSKAVENHRFTVNIPAPTSNDLVEKIVREYGGKFSIAEPSADVIATRASDEARDEKNVTARDEVRQAAKDGDLVAVVDALLKLIG